MKYLPTYLKTVLCLCLYTNFAYAQDTVSFKVFDRILFYDGYAKKVELPTPEGITRLANDCYTKKLNSAELDLIKDSLQLRVTLNPACDNYDRLGDVSLVFVEKGAQNLGQKQFKRIELARFITPFMDKNKSMQAVNYDYNLSHLVSLFQQKGYRDKYDFWIEFSVFGVPGAAQKQIQGCSDRNDTFFGSVIFNSFGKKPKKKSFLLKELSFKNRINNYDLAGTDSIGKTVKNFSFELDQKQEVKLFWITSNHGANRGGEEYIRRKHEVYLDNKLLYTYTPGGISCEPFRVYNTQNNGIYGKTAKTLEGWTSWNNWCPGAPVPLRMLLLGKLNKGKHTLTIKVPEATFVDKQGYVLTSAYITN